MSLYPTEAPSNPADGDDGDRRDGYLPYDVRQRSAAAAERPTPAPSLPKSDDGDPFNPMEMYAARNRNPYRGYTPMAEPERRNSLQAANINPQAHITATDHPLNVGRTTGSVYDFMHPKWAAADNSELFNMDVSGKAARTRLGGDDG
jgi:hypothetical protein